MRQTVLLVCVVFLLNACSGFRGTRGATTEQQQKTVETIRALGTAVEAFKLAEGHYPVSTKGEVEEIRRYIYPTYVSTLPEEDGWGNDIEYYCAQPEGPYYIISFGSDKERDVGLYQSNQSPTGIGFSVITSLENDIIFSNGVFVRYPQGAIVADSQ